MFCFDVHSCGRKALPSMLIGFLLLPERISPHIPACSAGNVPSPPTGAAAAALTAPRGIADAQTAKRGTTRTEQHRGDRGDQQPVPLQQAPQVSAAPCRAHVHVGGGGGGGGGRGTMAPAQNRHPAALPPRSLSHAADAAHG